MAGCSSTAPGGGRLTLETLTVDGVRQLVEEAGSPLDPDVLRAGTDGNPFYVTEVPTAGGAELPATVRDAVLARTARLSPSARRVRARTRRCTDPGGGYADRSGSATVPRMPLWAWILVVIAALLAVMWVYDRRVRVRGARLNDPAAMARGVTGPQGNPEAHRGAMQPGRYGPGVGGGS